MPSQGEESDADFNILSAGRKARSTNRIVITKRMRSCFPLTAIRSGVILPKRFLSVLK